MNQAERRVWLIKALLDERPDGHSIAIPAGANEQRDLLRALMNVRPPEALAAETLAAETLDIQDAYLQQRLLERGGATDAGALPYRDRVAIWRGDITLLKADAIVNAANSQMLGCFVPGHRCIDNAIHTYAGMQLRLACDDLMCKQGHEEPTARVRLRRRSIYPAATFSTPSALSCPAISLALTRNCCYGAATPAAWKRRRAEDSAPSHSVVSQLACLAIPRKPPRAWPSIPFAII